jgi:serine/threonine-protein kinase
LGSLAPAAIVPRATESAPLAHGVAPYEVLGVLGDRKPPVRVARRSAAGRASLVVVERFEDALRGGSEEGAAFLRRARRVATLAHPNLAQVREVLVNGDDLLVASPFLDGEKLSELWCFDREVMPIEVALRVLVGVLTGLGALHRLSDAQQRPLNLAHGEVAPATILLGVDGVARVLHAVARQAPGAEPEFASLGYVAPEVQAGDAQDERADVFSAGVLLWEMLSGRPCTEDPAAGIPLASVPEGASWAKGLVEVAARAIEAAPADRWPTAVAMAAQIHQAAGSRVASVSTVAAWVGSRAGERVRARRDRIESAAGPDASQSVSLPVSAPRIPGANARVAGGASLPHTPTLVWSQSTDTATAVASPSESKVQPRLFTPVAARSRPPALAPALAVEPEHASDTAIEVVPHGVRPALDEKTIANPTSAAPSAAPAPIAGRIEDPARAPRPVEPRSKGRRPLLTAALGALGVVALVLAGAWVAHRRVPLGSRSTEPAPIEAVSSADLVDLGIIATPRLVPTAQRELKHPPGKRAAGHPVHPRPAGHGGAPSP